MGKGVLGTIVSGRQQAGFKESLRANDRTAPLVDTRDFWDVS